MVRGLSASIYDIESVLLVAMGIVRRCVKLVGILLHDDMDTSQVARGRVRRWHGHK